MATDALDDEEDEVSETDGAELKDDAEYVGNTVSRILFHHVKRRLHADADETQQLNDQDEDRNYGQHQIKRDLRREPVVIRILNLLESYYEHSFESVDEITQCCSPVFCAVLPALLRGD